MQSSILIMEYVFVIVNNYFYQGLGNVYMGIFKNWNTLSRPRQHKSIKMARIRF